MDNHISNDPNNPINYTGKDIEQCNICQNDLNTSEEKEEKMCFECIEEKEERKNLETNINAQRDVINKFFDSFNISTTDTIENKKFDDRLKNFINNLK